MLDFEWDETKNKSNRKKHGVWFEEAAAVFDDPNGRLFLDDDGLHAEDRYVLIGSSSDERILIVVHCYRGNDSKIRLISARKATKRERKFYEEGI